MKKIKTLYTSLLSLIMCGTIGMSAGCKEKAPVAPVAKEATKEEKLTSYKYVETSLETMATSGDVYKITLDLDVVITETTIEEDPNTGDLVSVPSSEKNTVEISGEMWFMGKEETLSVDAVINGYAAEEEVEPYMYAAAYIRGDDLYVGQITGDTKITEAQIGTIEYQTYSLSEIMGRVTGGGFTTVADDSVSTEDGAAIEGMIMKLLPKITNGFLSGMNGMIATSGNVKIFSVDVKKELNSIYTTAEKIVNLIGNDTTVGDLLDSEVLKNFFNKYFGNLTVEDMNTILPLIGVQADPLTGDDLYTALVGMLKEMPVDETGTLLKDMPVGEVKGEISEMLKAAKAQLDTINSMKYSFTLTDNMLSAFSVDVDIKDAVDLDLAFAFTKVSYTFIDVNELNVVALS